MLNYQKFIQKYTLKNLEHGLIKPEEKELYEYGYLLVALQLINIAGVVSIGILFRCFLPMLLFTVSMIPLRSYAGGYHASSPEKCTLISLVLEVTVALALNWLTDYGHFSWLIWVVLAGELVIWILAPVEAVNKPLSLEESSRYRRKSRQILLFEQVLLLVCAICKVWAFAFAVALCHITVALLVLAAYRFSKSKIQ